MRAAGLPRDDAGGRAERAAMLRMIRSEIRAVKLAKKQQLLTDEIAGDRVRRWQVLGDKVRLGLHRCDDAASGGCSQRSASKTKEKSDD